MSAGELRPSQPADVPKRPALGQSERERKIRAEVAQRGLKIERFGVGWRVFGVGVDMLVASIESLSVVDLTPKQ